MLETNAVCSLLCQSPQWKILMLSRMATLSLFSPNSDNEESGHWPVKPEFKLSFSERNEILLHTTHSVTWVVARSGPGCQWCWSPLSWCRALKSRLQSQGDGAATAAGLFEFQVAEELHVWELWDWTSVAAPLSLQPQNANASSANHLWIPKRFCLHKRAVLSDTWPNSILRNTLNPHILGIP